MAMLEACSWGLSHGAIEDRAEEDATARQDARRLSM